MNIDFHPILLLFQKNQQFSSIQMILETLNSLDVKNYNWLQESFIEYYQFNIDPTPRADKTGNARYYNLNKFYNNISNEMKMYNKNVSSSCAQN
jgi:hypothetical protein